MLVLLLHHIGAPPKGVRQRKLYLLADQLRRHVDYLERQGYRFTTLTRGLDAKDEEKIACVTFDDGFRDVLDAREALREVPATVFAVTSRVGEKNVVFDGDQGVAPADLMSWDELNTLKEAGWEIGSHAHRHVRKPSLEDLQESRSSLKQHLGLDATALAYPYGAYDAKTVEAARTAGFRCAATTKSGTASRDTPFTLRRVILSSFGAQPVFEHLKLAGVHHGLYPLWPRPL